MTRLTPSASSINGVVAAAVGGWGTGRDGTVFLFPAYLSSLPGSARLPWLENQPGRVAADGLAGNWITEGAEASVCAC